MLSEYASNKSKMTDDRHTKNKKMPYICNGLANIHDIWRNDENVSLNRLDG